MTTIDADGLETHYEDQGEGPTLVLVHAATLDLHSWRHQTQALKQDHRVIAYDLRGHGQTPDPDDRPYSVDTLADDLARFVDALGLDRPIVCGLSLGGMVAQTYASRHPHRLSALVLAGAPTPTPLSVSERLQRSLLPRTIVPVARLIGYERMKKGLIRVQEKVHGKEAMGAFTARDLPPMSTEAFARAVRCFASFDKTQVDLRKLTMPTLVMYGENEPPFIREHAERLQQVLPDVTVRVLPDAGHASCLDAPEAFTDAVRRFLNETVLGGTETHAQKTKDKT